MEQYNSTPSGSLQPPLIAVEQPANENVRDFPALSKSDTSTSGQDPNSSSQDSEECLGTTFPNKTYHVRQGVRDKNGRLKGFINLQVSIQLGFITYH
jgi:hypothetical protein